MARNVATFVVDVITKNLRKANTDVDNLGKGAQNAQSGYNKANQAAGGFYNTQAKGVIGTANSTRSFSKLAETMGQNGGGIVGAYATLAANIFAVSAAFNALRGAAQVQQLQAGLEAMGNRMGTTLSVAAENVREISGYTLTVEQSLRSTAQIASAGFGTKSMTDLAKVANDVSVALGRNMTDSMDRLTRGVVKLEPELLDELGLMTKIGESTAKYANQLGKSESQLSNFEKRQGFMNAILAEGETKFGGLAASAGNTRNLDLLGASFQDLAKDILNMVNVIALPLAGLFSNKGVLLAGMVLFLGLIRKQLIPGLANAAQKAAEISEQTEKAAVKQAKGIRAAGGATNQFFKEYVSLVEKGKDATTQFGIAQGQLQDDIKQIRGDMAGASVPDKKIMQQLQDDAQRELRAINAVEAARVKAARTSMESNAIVSAGQGHVRVAWGQVRLAVKMYSAELALANASTTGFVAKSRAGLNVVKVGLYQAATAARVFGAALLNAIPIIGQVILALTLLWEGAKWLKSWWEGPKVKAFNEAMDEQATIIGNLGERYTEMNRAAVSTMPIAQRQAAVYKIMTNTVRENVEAFEKAKMAQDAMFKDKGTTNVKVGDTAQFKALKELRDFGGPEVKKQINDALGREGLAGALDNADKKIPIANLEKMSKILSVDLRQGAVTLGDHITDLAEAFKGAQEAISEFTRSAIPSTPYDTVAKQMNSVANAVTNVSNNAAKSDNYVARMAQSLLAASDNVKAFLDTDTQQMIRDYETVDQAIQSMMGSTDAATVKERERLQAVKNNATEMLAIRSSELYQVQEMFLSAQSIARATQNQIALEQTRLDKLNSFTAITGSSIKARREAENKIIQLQANQIKSQVEITKRQIQMKLLTLEHNKSLLEQNKIYQEIALSAANLGGVNENNFQAEITRRTISLNSELKRAQEGGVSSLFGRSVEDIEKDIDAVTRVSEQMGVIRQANLDIKDAQDGIAASNAQIAATLGKQTSASVINAEMTAKNAANTAQNTQKQLEYQQQLLKNDRILSDIEVKRRGRGRSTAEEYALIVKEQGKMTIMQQEAIANAAQQEVQEMRLEQARAVGDKEAVAAYQVRIDSAIKIANAKMTEIDLQNRLNILDKFSFDIHKEGLEMQQNSLSYMEKQIDAQSEYNALQREGRILTAEVARKRGGRASNEFSKRSDDITEARAQLNLAKEQAGMRKAVINLEYALLEAQRQQMVWNLTAQQKILGETSAQGQQLGAVIQRLQEGAAAVQAGQEAALASVDQNISNLTKKLQSAGLKEGGNFVGSGLRDLVKSQQDAARAARTPDSKPIEALKTVVHPLEQSNQALANMQGDLTSATRDLTAQLRSMASGPLPKLEEALRGTRTGTLDDAAQMAKRGGLSVTENDAYGWQVRGRKASDRKGHSANSAHYRNAAIDINAPGIGDESKHPVWGRRFDALAEEYRKMGFKVIWRAKDHYNHMHVEMTDNVRKAAERLGVTTAEMVQIPLKAATDTIKAAEAVLPTATAPAAAPVATATPADDTIVVNGRRKARTPTDIGSLTEQFENITQVGDFNMLEVFENMADKLGPEGAIVTTIMQGMTQLGGSISNFQKVMKDPDASFGDKFAAGASIMQSALGTIQGVLQAASDAKVAGIDREIAAEQKRDGKSAESVAKIQAMERRKDAIQRKSFNTNKKIMMAQAVIATAAGIAQALTLGPIVGPIMAAVIGAMGAAQLAIIAGTSYQSSTATNFDQKSMPTNLTIGKRGDGVDVAKHNQNIGGEIGYLRGDRGTGSNSSNYATIGSAYGGPLPRGYGNNAYVVGEKGPEVIERDTPLSVRPLNDNENSQPAQANFHISAFDGESVNDMLNKRKGDIIDMLREAANANGTRFMEDVKTSHYKKAGGGASRI